MSLSLNKVFLSGRITKDLELKKTPSGVSVVTFSVAVDREYGGENKETDFLDIVAWRGTAEFICRYFRKGMPIFVEGSVQARKWKDKDGYSHTAVEIVADKAKFVESKGADQSTAPAYAPSVPSYAPAPAEQATFLPVGDDEDLPF